MSRIDDESYLPICEFCGKPMRLIGIQDKAKMLGMRLPDDQEQYIIQCCGHTLIIDDVKIAEIATRNLKRYYGIAE